MVLPRMLREALPKLKIGWFLHRRSRAPRSTRRCRCARRLCAASSPPTSSAFGSYDYVRCALGTRAAACSRPMSTSVDWEVHSGRAGLDGARRRSAPPPVAVDAFRLRHRPRRGSNGCSRLPISHTKLGELERRFAGKRRSSASTASTTRAPPALGARSRSFRAQQPAAVRASFWCRSRRRPRRTRCATRSSSTRCTSLVGRINGRFGTLEHSPIHYLDRAMLLLRAVRLVFDGRRRADHLPPRGDVGDVRARVHRLPTRLRRATASPRRRRT